jgi:general secretion pathway protein D
MEKEILEQNIPLLSEIPFLGWLFKYESKQLEDINLTIILELIDDTAFHFSKFEDIKF